MTLSADIVREKGLQKKSAIPMAIERGFKRSIKQYFAGFGGGTLEKRGKHVPVRSKVADEFSSLVFHGEQLPWQESWSPKKPSLKGGVILVLRNVSRGTKAPQEKSQRTPKNRCLVRRRLPRGGRPRTGDSPNKKKKKFKTRAPRDWLRGACAREGASLGRDPAGGISLLRIPPKVKNGKHFRGF